MTEGKPTHAIHEELRSLERRAQALRKERRQAWSRNAAVQLAGLSKQTVSGWFSQALPRVPKSSDDLWSLVRIYASWAGETPRRAFWNNLWEQAAAVGGNGSQTILGRRIRDWGDPFILEVHRSIDSGLGQADLPPLPPYVRRPHDSQLDDLVSRAINGESVAAVLIGESATGKTRACWEAIQKIPDSWNLWHPIYPGPAESLLEGIRAGVPPRTVLWVNEMQLYLDTPARAVGELVSAGLRELLRDSRQGPHLLLGTMWPEYWNRLTCHPGTGKEDAHPQARMLLADSDIPVPNSFFGESLDALRDAAESDPRLAESYRDGSSSRVRATQFLAGTPVQMARYRNAPDAARAVLDAAIDLRRFGQGPAIPSRLLAGAAAVAIGTDLLNGLDDDWFESALVYLLAPCRGVSGPLIRVRHFPGSPLPGQELFQVADYLEQVGRAARNSLFPSSAIVDVALREITDTEGLKAFGEFLAYSGRLFHAAQFHLRAVELGDCEAAGKLADLLEFAEDRSGAVEIARIRLLGGDPLGSEYLAWYLYANGQQDEAMRLCIEEFDLGNSRPLMKIREAYEFDDDAPGYRALEGRILSRRFPGLYDEVFCSKSRSIEEFSAELATRLGILVDEARVLVDEEVDLIASRLEQICEALRVNADEIKASTVRLKEWVESFKADWGVEVKSFRARIEACQEMGDYDMARRLIGEGMDRGIVGLEVLGSHLERYGGLDSSEPIERLGVDWSGNPNASWNLADVRRVNHEILEA